MKRSDLIAYANSLCERQIKKLEAQEKLAAAEKEKAAAPVQKAKPAKLTPQKVERVEPQVRAFSLRDADMTIYFIARENQVLAMVILRPYLKKLVDGSKFFFTKEGARKTVQTVCCWRRNDKDPASAGFAHYVLFTLLPKNVTLLSDPLERNAVFWKRCAEYAIQHFHQVFLYKHRSRELVATPLVATLEKYTHTDRAGLHEWFSTTLVGISK